MFLVLGAASSFIGGFYLSNVLNGGEIRILRAENERLAQSINQGEKSNSPPSLSKEEIRKKIVEAEQNKDNFTFQKALGLALYRYAKLRQDRELLPSIVKLLKRANTLNEDDYDVIVSLGNVYFDIGRAKKNKTSLEKAKSFYKKALERNGKDVRVRVDLGRIYFLSNPPNYEKALKEYEEALKINPKHEKSLQSIIQVLIKLKRKEKAAAYLQTLKKINPQNLSAGEFERQLTEATEEE